MLWGEHGFMDLGRHVLATTTSSSSRPSSAWSTPCAASTGTTSSRRPRARPPQDLLWAQYPSDDEIDEVGVRGIYLGNYVDWDANTQTELMIEEYG